MNTHAGRKLNRPTGARFALLRSLAASLLRHEQVETTYAKAREVSRFAEKLIAVAKRKDLPSIRRVHADLPDKDISKKLFDVLVPRYQARAGGCTRVFKIGQRRGDGAEMALVKLVQ